MKFALLLLCLLSLAGCTTARTKNAQFETIGSVKSLVVTANGDIQATDISSPFGEALGSMQLGMLGRAFGILR